jgi:cytochrome c oxidase subunit 5b
MPDTLGHSVGPERFELLARLAGNEDPFEMNVRQRSKGTLNDPTLIPSLYDKRLVGCVCEEDSIAIQWMFLNKGEPKRCACGNWFKLVELDTSKFGQN